MLYFGGSILHLLAVILDVFIHLLNDLFSILYGISELFAVVNHFFQPILQFIQSFVEFLLFLSFHICQLFMVHVFHIILIFALLSLIEVKSLHRLASKILEAFAGFLFSDHKFFVLVFLTFSLSDRDIKCIRISNLVIHQLFHRVQLVFELGQIVSDLVFLHTGGLPGFLALVSVIDLSTHINQILLNCLLLFPERLTHAQSLLFFCVCEYVCVCTFFFKEIKKRKEMIG